jgi:Cof subfamily protein (haloacid dehalogenase superfamily)
MRIDPKNIQAIAIDLDGTVLNSDSRLTDKTIQTLKKCMESGIKVIIATGRSVAAAESYRACLGATGPMVYYNGAEVVDMPAGTLLDSHFVNQNIIAWCADLSRNEDIHFQVFFSSSSGHDDILMAENPSKASDIYHARTGLSFQFGDLRKALSEPDPPACIKGIFIDDNKNLVRIRSLIEKKFGNAVNLVLSADFILETLAPGVSKGSGLTCALQRRNIDARNVISFGDEENDLPMFGITGFSAAPANARDSVKAAANIVIGSNDQDGVAVFLSELFAL